MVISGFVSVRSFLKARRGAPSLGDLALRNLACQMMYSATSEHATMIAAAKERSTRHSSRNPVLSDAHHTAIPVANMLTRPFTIAVMARRSSFCSFAMICGSLGGVYGPKFFSGDVVAPARREIMV